LVLNVLPLEAGDLGTAQATPQSQPHQRLQGVVSNCLQESLNVSLRGLHVTKLGDPGTTHEFGRGDVAGDVAARLREIQGGLKTDNGGSLRLGAAPVVAEAALPLGDFLCGQGRESFRAKVRLDVAADE
jgi:hypothetical protein